MDFSKLPPSKHWAALNYQGAKFAEVWFKPEGEPFGLTFRILQNSFQIPGLDQQLTIGNLLRAVAIQVVDVESWRLGDVVHSGMNGSNPELETAVAPPLREIAHVDILVRLSPPPEVVANRENTESEIPLATWQDLEARWKFILGLEASIDGMRVSMGSLQTEMESAWSKTMSVEEKLHASRADVAQWTKAKNRIHQSLPKVKDFIHRSVWAIGAPERKRLETYYKDHIQTHVPFPEVAAVLEELEALQKARQVLSSLGKAVYQEGKNIANDVKSCYMALQSNARSNEQRKKGASGSGGGKFFKNVRKMTGP